MSSRLPATPRDDWRRAGASTERRTSGPKWRREAEALAPRRVRRTRPLKVAGVTLALGLLGGLLIWVVTWLWPPHPAELVLVGAGYEQNLAIPHNAYGRKSLRILAGRALPPGSASAWGAGRLRLAGAPLNFTGDVAWDEGLARIRGGTLMLFLALHGGSDQDGAYFLADDADARPLARNRLRLTTVLDRLARLPAHVNKVLILDATQIQSHWTLGMISNDFARELAKLEPRVREIPRLVVLSASDVEQRSWGFDLLGQTIFGAALIEGLEGAAVDDDGRIDAEDLFHHVRRRVEWWAGVHFRKRQTPVMLPGGVEGLRRARAIELCGAVGLAGPRSGDDGGAAGVQGETLRAAWQDYQRLRALVPPPWIHRAHKWRVYKDTLIRYDELIRTGANDKAAELALGLHQLVVELERHEALDLSSDQCTLTMNTLQGRVGLESEALRQPFEKLWEASRGDEAKLWQQLEASSPALSGGAPGELRRGLFDLLIQRAADDPARQLDRAVRLAKVLVDPASPPPIEVQELIMIARDLPREGPPGPGLYDQVAQALRVRRLAERAVLTPIDRKIHPYAGVVLPWVRTRMDEADALRRQGLDLLFASDASSWGRGGDLLRRAEVIYHEVQDDAKQVRIALGTRDEVLEGLPYYTGWLGQIRTYMPRIPNVRLDELEASVQQLWDATHTLIGLLDRADPRTIRRASAGDSPPADLVTLTDTVRDLYQDVVAGFESHIRSIDESDLGGLWSEIRIALRVPFDDVRMRERLLANLGRIERRFLVDNSRFEVAPPVTEATNRSIAIDRGRLQGLMALGVVGQAWFNSYDGGGNSDRFARARGRLARLEDDPAWPETLRAVGGQIGDALRRMPVEIDRLMAEGLDAAEPRDEADVAAANRLWRQLDGSLGLKAALIPADAYRQLVHRDLLLWQAGRTLADHWYSEDPALEPYYRTAGLRFVDDARRLDPRPVALRTSAKAAQAALERPGRFGFQGPARLVLTSEQRVEAEYRLQPDPSLPAPSGFPVFWVDPGADLRSLVPESGHRIAQPIGPRPEAPIVCTFASPRLTQSEESPPPTPRVEYSTYGMRGLFRGQRFAMETTTDLHLLPEQVAGRHPVPPGASLSVRAQDAVLDRLGTSSGAIAIVLDCSGSMGPASGQAWGPSTKYREATRALREVLRGLTKGTIVSVWAFGQAVGFEKTVKDAERTITRVQDPIAWDPGDPGQLTRLMARVDYPALEPWNESPIVRTMLLARDDLRNVAGFKTLLVLTDGMDNRYERDPLANPHRAPIPVAIRELFSDSGIEINIVGYKVVGPEAERARAQFRVIEQLPIPGKFYEVNEAPELAGVLGKAMGRRLRYWVEREDNVLASGTPGEGLTTSRLGANDRWFAPALAPGGYKLVIDPLRRQERNVSLNNGDLLIVQLDAARVGVDFRRVEFAREDFSWKPAAAKNGWRLAVLQDQLVGPSGLQMLCTLEKAFSRLETSISVVRPREMWLELVPATQPDVPFSFRWSNRPGYPAAAWGVNVPRWPSSPGTSSPDRPIVRIWWNPDQDSPASGGLDRGPDFDLETGKASSPVPIEGNDVIVESVRVEDHRVETRPGVREVKSCLVVRLSHSRGKPILVRPLGLVSAGSEQRFYTSAAKVTALYWPVTRDEAGSMLTGLSLYSLNAFKAQAERRGFSVEMRDLPIPRPDDVPPPEVPIREVGISASPLE